MKTAALSFIETTIIARKPTDTTANRLMGQESHPVHDTNTHSARKRSLTAPSAIPSEGEPETRQQPPIIKKKRLISVSSLWRKIQYIFSKISLVMPDTSQRNVDQIMKKQFQDAANTADTSLAGATDQQNKAAANTDQERIARYKAAGM